LVHHHGYIGYDESGGLTEKIRNKPYSVVLFDEIEKAHVDVLNLLLQILDDGVLTDSKSRIIDFKNTIIIMTSNIGANILLGNKKIGFESMDEKENNKKLKNKVKCEIKNYFKPEFINRIDEIIVFDKLTRENFKEISKIMLDELKENLKQNNIVFDFSDGVINKVVENIKDEKEGARMIRKIIKDIIVNKLTDYILNNPNDKKIFCDIENEIIKIRKS